MVPLLEIRNLKVAFQSAGSRLEVVRGVDICLERGEILGMLGESGSGKSVSASTIAMLIDSGDGHVSADRQMFDGQSLADASEKELCALRGKRIAYIFQNPVEALSPNKRIREQFHEGFIIHHIPYSEELIEHNLLEVGLENPEIILSMYPHQLSGGEAQRVMIAMAVALKPDLLIADEPTSSVDASLRDRIIELLRAINRKHGISMLVITHDYDVVKALCHRVIVLYGGLVMEACSVQELMSRPFHPYASELMACVQSINSGGRLLHTLEGTPLDPADFRDACPFLKRCARRQLLCEAGIPALRMSGSRSVRCLYPLADEEGSHA